MLQTWHRCTWNSALSSECQDAHTRMKICSMFYQSWYLAMVLTASCGEGNIQTSMLWLTLKDEQNGWVKTCFKFTQWFPLRCTWMRLQRSKGGSAATGPKSAAIIFRDGMDHGTNCQSNLEQSVVFDILDIHLVARTGNFNWSSFGYEEPNHVRMLPDFRQTSSK